MIKWFNTIYALYKWVCDEDVEIVYIDESNNKLKLTYAKRKIG